MCVGAIAAGLYGIPRATKDIDLLVSMDVLGRSIWLPTAEDVVVQKLRWGRPKDLEDARDVLAVQDPETLDMTYVRRWCGNHGTQGRVDAILDSIPPL